MVRIVYRNAPFGYGRKKVNISEYNVCDWFFVQQYVIDYRAAIFFIKKAILPLLLLGL
jgi:hypothetical protein